MNIPRPDFGKAGGLVSVIVQDAQNLRVLMLGYTNEACYREMVEEGKVVFYSRSRNVRWLKGETSGNTLEVQEMLLDCDSDAVLILVKQNGEGTCHTNAVSCFFRNAITGEIEGEVPKLTSKDDPKGELEVAKIGIPFTPSQS